jgi:hypothetical protein
MKRDYKVLNYELIVGKKFDKTDCDYEVLNYNEAINIFTISKTIKKTKEKVYSSIKPSDLLILMSREN